MKYKELYSTQTWAHEHPELWNPDGWTAITAGTQSAGRGSGSTTWTDIPEASLLMTLVSPPLNWSSAYVFVRHAQASLVLAELFQSSGADVRLKWPNDLYLNGRKLGGLLTEAYWNQGICKRWFLGIGINVLDAPQGAAFLEGWTLSGLHEVVADRLIGALNQPIDADVLTRYCNNLVGWRQCCTFRDTQTLETFTASPRFLSPDGRLGLQLSTGSLRWVSHKEVSWTGFGLKSSN